MLLFGRVFATDGVIDLIPARTPYFEPELGFGQGAEFIITPHGKRREAGRISLRDGDSRSVYYFGHIGYHVDPPYQGRHFAARACVLASEWFRKRYMHTVVITCDTDNIPSEKTCLLLGSIAERTVNVPLDMQQKYIISSRKKRYVWRIPNEAGRKMLLENINRREEMPHGV